MKSINSDFKTVSKLIKINKVSNNSKANDFNLNNFNLNNSVIDLKTDVFIINFKMNNSAVKLFSIINFTDEFNVNKLKSADELNNSFKNYEKN